MVGNRQQNKTKNNLRLPGLADRKRKLKNLNYTRNNQRQSSSNYNYNEWEKNA